MEKAQIILLFEFLYFILVVGVCLLIVKDTRSSSKTLAYLLFVVFIPAAGIIFYFSFGINYRKRRLYQKKLHVDHVLLEQLNQEQRRLRTSEPFQQNTAVHHNRELIRLLSNKRVEGAHVFSNTEVTILNNGEKFFPALIEALENATKHIHIQFYIYENDTIGNQIKDILIQKAKEGVIVRFIYDAYGSRKIRKNIVKELRANGVQAFPFNEIKLIALANRINYRNHRKIVVVDGHVGFTGGINISDKYINKVKRKQLFWRDTNVRLVGSAAHGLQRIFLTDWNFCSKENIAVNQQLFPTIETQGEAVVQIASNGPDSALPTILYAIIQAINVAEKEVLITTPYYIPERSLQEALIIAALSGIQVKLLIPKRGDALLVDVVSQSYLEELLKVGVHVFQYEKGFIHAKTFVTDRKLVSIGTANLDLRSFDLNFEVNALIYDEKIAEQMAQSFEADINNSKKLELIRWKKRSKFRKAFERLARLLAPFL